MDMVSYLMGQANSSGGSDLPPVSGSGKILVSVNGSWVQQDGYGYETSQAFEPIVWDGSTEGRDIIDDQFCKVADAVPVSALYGALFSYTEGMQVSYTIKQSDVENIIDDVYEISVFDDAIQFIVCTENGDGYSAGIYFPIAFAPYNLSLNAPASVQKIDKKFIPIGTLSDVLEWGCETQTNGLETNIQLPPVEDTTTANELTLIFWANNTTYSFTAPYGFILGDESGFAGLMPGNTITYTDMTVGSLYEINFKVLDNSYHIIGMVKKEWRTA